LIIKEKTQHHLKSHLEWRGDPEKCPTNGTAKARLLVEGGTNGVSHAREEKRGAESLLNCHIWGRCNDSRERGVRDSADWLVMWEEWWWTYQTYGNQKTSRKANADLNLKG